MHAVLVVIISEFIQLARQVHGVPEGHAIEILPANGADQAFDERMRDRYVGNRLDFLDFEYTQVREPAVKAKQRIVIGAEVFRYGLAGDGVVEHPADGYAVDVCARHTKTDDAPRKHVYHHQHPIAAQKDRFAAEHVRTPQAILRVPDEGQPRRPDSSRIARPVVLRKHAAHDILVDLDAEGMSDLLGDAHTTEPGVAAFHLNDGPLFPATELALGTDRKFAPAGLKRVRWRRVASIRIIFRDAFVSAGLPYFNPHSFRDALVHLSQSLCQTLEEYKAVSQNLGHGDVLTTLNSYVKVFTTRQREIIANLAKSQPASEPNVNELVKMLVNKMRNGSEFGIKWRECRDFPEECRTPSDSQCKKY